MSGSASGTHHVTEVGASSQETTPCEAWALVAYRGDDPGLVDVSHLPPDAPATDADCGDPAAYRVTLDPRRWEAAEFPAALCVAHTARIRALGGVSAVRAL